MEAMRKKWWLEGSETCGFCLQRYCYEERYHCVACDADLCPQCVVVVRQTAETWCPQCAADDRIHENTTAET
jgi:hypothetical protein